MEKKRSIVMRNVCVYVYTHAQVCAFLKYMCSVSSISANSNSRGNTLLYDILIVFFWVTKLFQYAQRTRDVEMLCGICS